MNAFCTQTVNGIEILISSVLNGSLEQEPSCTSFQTSLMISWNLIFTRRHVLATGQELVKFTSIRHALDLNYIYESVMPRNAVMVGILETSMISQLLFRAVKINYLSCNEAS